MADECVTAKKEKHVAKQTELSYAQYRPTKSSFTDGGRIQFAPFLTQQDGNF